MKRNIRRIYYDAFAKFYDGFVALHSSDSQGVGREYLSSTVPVTEGDRILDMCTGTGVLLLRLRNRVGMTGLWSGSIFPGGC